MGYGGYPDDAYQQLMEAVYGGGRWSPDQPYSWSNDIPDQLYDLYKPLSDSQASTRANRAAGGSDSWGNFSNDVILNADPLVQPYLTEVLSNAKGDLATAMNWFNDSEYQDELRNRIGRTEWDDWAANADGATRHGLRTAGSGEAKDEVIVGAISRALENLLAQGSPSVARNTGLQNSLLQEVGGRAVGSGATGGAGGGPGGMSFSGPGFGTGEDRDFVAGGGYVGPGSSQEMPRQNLLAELSDDELNALTGGEPLGGQMQALRNYKPAARTPIRRSGGNRRGWLDRALDLAQQRAGGGSRSSSSGSRNTGRRARDDDKKDDDGGGWSWPAVMAW